MRDFDGYAVAPARFLLPGGQTDLRKWAVIACDQHTSEPEYWRAVETFREGAPSALDCIYPEAWLSQGDSRIEAIDSAMRVYRQNVLTRETEGFVLVERETTDGIRAGLLAAVDLEQYDYSAASRSAVRPTEATVEERVPPRVRIRREATLEMGHVLLLADDPADLLLGPLLASKERLPLLYDFDLMLGGGHIRAWHVGPEQYPDILRALKALRLAGNGLDFAVGDGNHSLAAASACWKEIRETLSPAERANHPARWAMAEINNLHADSMRFHSIHRAVFGDCTELPADFERWLERRGMHAERCAEGPADMTINGVGLHINNPDCPLPVGIVQPFLDEWLRNRPGCRIDYIHGDDTLTLLAADGATTIALPAMDKAALFPSVRIGPLPRKTFSMGEAQDKRYYLEARAIRP